MAFVNKVLKVYNKIPVGMLNCIAPFWYMLPASKRYGKVFWRQYNLLMNLDISSEEACRETEDKMFLKTVRAAYRDVPYYKRIFDEYGIDVSTMRSAEDIKVIPFLTKEIIREEMENLISEKYESDKLIYVTTSGSTGNPLGFYQDKDIVMREWAYTNYIWSRVGYRPDSSRLVLRGKVFRNQREKGLDWQWDALKRELSCNIFNMSVHNLQLYCEKIEKYKPEYIHGYMSAILVLCKYIEKRGLQHHFKGVLATSETVPEEQKTYVEKVLCTRVFSFYGHSERLVIAAECEYSSDYHVEPMYGYAEIIDHKGQVITEPGVKGELVATGFMNDAMPLLRYRTGDIAEWSGREDCACGRAFRRIKGVSGRWKQDVLVNKEGALVSLTAINMHSRVFEHIIKYQFFQEKAGSVILKIVPNTGFCEEDKAEIKRQIKEKVGDALEMDVQEVEDIPVCKNGKFKIVDQRIETDGISEKK